MAARAKASSGFGSCKDILFLQKDIVAIKKIRVNDSIFPILLYLSNAWVKLSKCRNWKKYKWAGFDLHCISLFFIWNAIPTFSFNVVIILLSAKTILLSLIHRPLISKQRGNLQCMKNSRPCISCNKQYEWDHVSYSWDMARFFNSDAQCWRILPA